jgi:hypothetical protein
VFLFHVRGWGRPEYLCRPNQHAALLQGVPVVPVNPLQACYLDAFQPQSWYSLAFWKNFSYSCSFRFLLCAVEAVSFSSVCLGWVVCTSAANCWRLAMLVEILSCVLFFSFVFPNILLP